MIDHPLHNLPKIRHEKVTHFYLDAHRILTKLTPEEQATAKITRVNWVNWKITWFAPLNYHKTLGFTS